jgi:hypothetical protein
MQILEAYCEELDEVLDIYGAKEAYFSLPEGQRKRFVFRCSDEQCRASAFPLVIGANYHKSVEESEKYVQPHFKSNAQQAHTQQCVWVQNDLVRKVAVDRQGGSRVSRAKDTDVIDVFQPKSHDTVLSPPRVSTALAARENPDHESHAHDGEQHGRLGISTTSRLECFVDCWSKLDANKRKESFIALGGHTITYYQAVVNPKHLYPSENGMRIVQGLVRFSLWPKDKPTMLYLNFADECERFPEVDTNRTLSIELPLSRIGRYRGGALLLDKLAQARKPDFYLKVYVWGKLLPSPRKGYLVDVKALGNLTLKVVPKKPLFQ